MRTRIGKYIGRRIRGLFRQKILSEHGLGIAVEAKNGLLLVDPRDFVISR